jgi:glycosyltransferase involved in cell wall biosynthesis
MTKLATSRAKRAVGSTAPPRSDRDGGLRVAMALYGDVTFDSRVLREAETLAVAGHNVTIYCLSGSAPRSAPFRTVPVALAPSSVRPDGTSPFLSGRNSSLVSKWTSRIRWIVGYARNLRGWGHAVLDRAGEVDVWHAHDLTALMAVGPLVRAPARLVYDSHELFIDTGTAVRLPRPARRLLKAYEARLARRAIVVITVNEGYAQVLKRRLRPRRLLIVRNCPPRFAPSTRALSRLRDATGVPASEHLVLYHGLFSGTRGIEQLADALMAPGLESTHAAFLGYGAMRAELEQLTVDPRFGGRLHLIDAVPPNELLDWVTGADADVIPLQRSTLNHWLCTPNKLWESLSAGVPVVVSDFPGMRRIVLDDPAGPLGAVCDPADPESIAAAIRTIIELSPGDRAALRARCLRSANVRWNWEAESARLVQLYADLLTLRGGLPGGEGSGLSASGV